MYRARILIISKRKELGIKHKKLIEALHQDAEVVSSMDKALAQIKQTEPELIIISDTIGQKLSDVCRQIRALTYSWRPAIVALSKSAEQKDKLEALNSGADDFWGEDIPSGEFSARISAHLRRTLESSLNPLTALAEQSLTLKALKRVSAQKSILYMEISGLEPYREIYGPIAYEKVLQTFGAIINSTLEESDFAGHLGPSGFIMITQAQKAPHVAPFLTFAFEGVLKRFYSEFDFQNKFMLYLASDVLERKVDLMRLCIGVLEIKEGLYSGHMQLLNALRGVLRLAQSSKGSGYIIDRPKLQGQSDSQRSKDRVGIMETDEALSYLLQSTCELRGFEGKVCKNLEELIAFEADVVILDYSQTAKGGGMELCRQIKALKAAPKIIFSSSVYEKKEILACGADLYLPKPYDIKTAMRWVGEFLA